MDVACDRYDDYTVTTIEKRVVGKTGRGRLSDGKFTLK